MDNQIYNENHKVSLFPIINPPLPEPANITTQHDNITQTEIQHLPSLCLWPGWSLFDQGPIPGPPWMPSSWNLLRQVPT